MSAPHITVRVLHPRRQYPTVQVFADYVLAFEQDVYREDARQIVSHLESNADHIARCAYMVPAIRRMFAEAVR